MRPIKFRGKRPFIGGWIYGLLDIQANDVEIFSRDNDTFKKGVVIPETIGQFTGLYDKNGKEVFEGDLLINEDEGSTPREVVFENGAFCIKFNDGSLGRLTQWEINRLKKEIIGNIHDNPELLKQ